VGDAAFMTTPMNGMGIDLSMEAGKLLADAIIEGGTDIEALWQYNRRYLSTVGAKAAKNEGLKNALLNMPKQGVDFLYKSGVIESQDLAGGGEGMTFSRLIKKLIHGMKRPKYFFAIVKGLIKGGKMARLYANAPKQYEHNAISKWAQKIEKCVQKVE
jgi:flavin-dependent dehydrogenase